MNGIVAIARREFVSLFRVPAGWIILTLFAFLSGILFVNQTLIPGQPGTMRYFFAAAGWMLVPVAPAISMRLLSEEYRTGSFETLRTTPAGDWGVAIGKYLGALAFLGAMLVPSLALPLTLAVVSEPMPEPGPIVSGYLMLALVGGFYLAIGMLASSLTSSQTLAFLGTVMALVMLLATTSLLAPRTGGALTELLRSVSIIERGAELGKGIIDTATVAFFVIGSAWMVVLTGAVLETRRLARTRWSVGVSVPVFVLATGAAAVFAGALTNSHHARFDVTSTGSHRLSQRATRMVERLPGPTRIVLAADLSVVDRVSADLVRDVLGAYDRSSDALETTVVDLSDPEGAERVRTIIDDLRDRDAASESGDLETLRTVASSLTDTALELEALSPMIRRAAELIDQDSPGASTNRAFFEQRAALARVQARDLDAAASEILEGLGSNRPAPGALADGPGELCGAAASQLEDLEIQLGRIIGAQGFGAALKAQCRRLRGSLSPLVDALARAHDELSRIEPSDAQRVARALESGEALMVVGPPGTGVAAVDLPTIMPPTRVLRDAGLSPAGVIAPRAQELIASALARIAVDESPILVLTHAGNQDDALRNPDLFTKTSELLERRGIDTIEWSVMDHDAPPTLGDLDPLGTRPVVYMTLAPDSARGGSGDGPTGSRRAEALGAALTRLIERGESVLVSVNPSIFHTYGDRDPIVAALEPLGIVPDPSLTILGTARGQTGARADPVTPVVMGAEAPDHPLASALRGLRAVIPWGVPIGLDERVGVEHGEILRARTGDARWGERDWIRLWTTPSNARAYLEDQPVYNASRDERRASWRLGASAERDAHDRRQRVVVVGSNSWASDAVVAGPERMIDGRVVRAYPGNRVLLEGSIAWLAGLDDLIAPGTEARRVATIGALDPGSRSRIRWILLGAIPLGILGAGGLVRLVFG